MPKTPKITITGAIFFLAVVAIIAGLLIDRTHDYSLLVDGDSLVINGRFSQIADVIESTGISLKPDDLVSPPLNTEADPTVLITVERAKEVHFSVTDEADPETRGDEKIQILRTHQDVLAEFLHENVITLRPGDRLYADGQLVSESESKNSPLPSSLVLVRGKEVTIFDDEKELKITTSSDTVGGALSEIDIRLFSSDAISPGLRARLKPQTAITIQRSVPINLFVDGGQISVRSLGGDVGDILDENGIILTGLDYTVPAITSTLEENSKIEVIRVIEQIEVIEEMLPYESLVAPTEQLEIDQTGLIQPGEPGILSREYVIRYENGMEVNRYLANETIIREPINEIIGYGTNIVVRSLDTPDGPIEYWRVVRMRVTAYTAATSGKSPDHPAYGITASGVPAGYGVVAVDPRIVPFRSYVYVPGYGKGFAGDTGGGVKGRFIDLGYDEGAIVPWNGYVDVYYLTPVPASNRINYRLPTTLP